MMNMLIHVRYTLDISRDKIERLVGRPDDRTEAWNRAAVEACEDYVLDNGPDALEHVTGEPDVECVS